MMIFARKLALIIPGILVFLTVTKGQKSVEFLSGEPFNIENGAIGNFLVSDNENYYLLHLNEKLEFEINSDFDATIEVFSKNLNYLNSLIIRSSDERKYKKLKPVSFIKTDDGFLLLAKNFNSATKVIKSFIFKISNEGHILKEKDVGEIDGVPVTLEDFNFFDLSKITENEHNHFVYSQIVPPGLDATERVNFIIYDENLEISSERLFNFPDDIQDFEISEIIVSETGVAFFRIETKSPFLTNKTIHQLIIYDITNDKTQSLEFSPNGGEIAKATLKNVEGGKVGYFGYFTKNQEDTTPKGVLYYLFDTKTGKLLRHKIYKISPDVLEFFYPKNLSSTSEYEQLKPQKIHLTDDNQLLLILEYNWKKLMLIQDRDGKPWTTPYFYANEIFILNFNAADEFENAGFVPKEQVQLKDFNQIGFASFVAKNSLFIIFNDNPKNAEEYQTKKLKTMKSSYLPMVAKFNYREASYSKEIFKTKNAGIIFEPGAIYKISDHSVIFLNHSKPFNLLEIRF